MKKLFALLSALAIGAAPAIASSSTWVAISYNWDRPNPGTVAEEMNWWGWAYYVDLQSVVRRGDLVYYYEDWIMLDQNKKPHKTLSGWNFETGMPGSRYMTIANCVTGESRREHNEFKIQPAPYNQVVQAVCEL